MSQQPDRLAEMLFGGVVRDRDVSLVFDYLREALQAAMQGREARPPDELAHRTEVIGEEVRRRGALAAEALLDHIEARLRDRVPPSPY